MLVTPLLLALTLAAPPPEPLASFRQARAVVDRSVAVHGAGPLSLSIEGDVLQVTQSVRPSPPFLRTPTRETLVFDPDGRRFRHTREIQWPYFTMKRTTIATAERVVDVDDAAGTASEGVRYGEAKRRVNWREPALLLQAAREAGASLRSVGRDTISFPQEDGVVVTVTIDAATNRVTRARWLEADPLFGDLEWEARYDAGRVVLRKNGVFAAELRVTRQAPPVLDPQTFALPTVSPRPASPPTTFEELAPGVVLVRNAGRADYHSLLVLFEDHSLLVEPLGGRAAAQHILAELAARYPRQPLRYVAATHHHDDHISAVREYLAAGATLLATAGNEPYFRSLAAAEHTIRPDALARATARAKIETIRPPHRLADAANEVVLLAIGPTEHVEESVIAWLPRAGIVFQGDLYRGGTAEPPRKSTLTFAAALERLALPVQRIAGAHGEVAGVEELRAMVKSPTR